MCFQAVSVSPGFSGFSVFAIAEVGEGLLGFPFWFLFSSTHPILEAGEGAVLFGLGLSSNVRGTGSINCQTFPSPLRFRKVIRELADLQVSILRRLNKESSTIRQKNLSLT